MWYAIANGGFYYFNIIIIYIFYLLYIYIIIIYYLLFLLFYSPSHKVGPKRAFDHANPPTYYFTEKVYLWKTYHRETREIDWKIDFVKVYALSVCFFAVTSVLICSCE
jgi:hypothetical protein